MTAARPATVTTQTLSRTSPWLARSVTTWLLRALSRYWTIAALLIAWDLTVRINGYNVIVMPTPWQVARALATDPLAFLPDTIATILVAGGGLLIGTAVGGVLAAAVWCSKLLEGLVTPAALLMRTVPIVVFIPVLARFFGYDSSSVLAVTAVICLFPAFVWTLAGMQSPQPGHWDVFAANGANRWRTLFLLALPASVPGLLMALRISAPTAIVGAILGEYLVGQRGLGFLFAESVIYGDPVQAWGAAVIATVMSIALFVAAGALEELLAYRFN